MRGATAVLSYAILSEILNVILSVILNAILSVILKVAELRDRRRFHALRIEDDADAWPCESAWNREP